MPPEETTDNAPVYIAGGIFYLCFPPGSERAASVCDATRLAYKHIRKALFINIHRTLYICNVCGGKGPSLVCEGVVYHLKWPPLALIMALSYSMVVFRHTQDIPPTPQLINHSMEQFLLFIAFFRFI